jgi:hypothetical protein
MDEIGGQHFEAFIEDLDYQIKWEWRHEMLHRKMMWYLNWATWAARVLLLAMSTYELNNYGKIAPELWSKLTIAILAVLNLGFPLLSATFRFQQRQEVHDKIAREYSSIRLELVSGQISLQEAVKRFTENRRQPTEAIIRRTP